MREAEQARKNLKELPWERGGKEGKNKAMAENASNAKFIQEKTDREESSREKAELRLGVGKGGRTKTRKDCGQSQEGRTLRQKIMHRRGVNLAAS